MNATPRDAGAMVDPEDQPGPGSKLREARKSAKLSLEDVASELHLNVATVRAIEEDSFEGLPAPAFVRGYITSYARLLKLPAAPILEAYDHQGFGPPRIVADITQAPQAKSTDIPVRLVTYLIAAGLLVMVVMWWQTREAGNAPPAGGDLIAEAPAAAESTTKPETTSKPERDMSVAENAVSADAEVVVEPATEPSAFASTEPYTVPESDFVSGDAPAEPALTFQPPGEAGAGAVDSTDPAGAVEASDTTLDSQVAAAESQQLTPIPVEAGPGENLLEFDFGQDSWLEVYDGSGDRLEYRLASQGERLVLSAKPPFRLVLGYAEGTRISLDGGELDLAPFTKRGTARVLISADGGLAAAPREDRNAAESSVPPATSDTPSTATAEAEVRPAD